MLHSLPLEFPLAMAFAEQLLSWKSEGGEGKSEDEPDTIPTSVLLQVVELLGEAALPPGGVWGQLSQGPLKELRDGRRGHHRQPRRTQPPVGFLPFDVGLGS